MKDTDYTKLIQLSYVGGGFIPANDPAQELSETLKRGEVITFQEVTKRDLSFHRAYFALLNFIYDYLPKSFHNKVPREYFYQFLKHLKGQYKVLFTFKDGTKLVEYDSISFGSMSQVRFKDYVREQLPFIYENVIGAFFEGEMYSNIVDTVENEFQRFLQKL